MEGKKPLCGEFCNDYCQNFVVIVVFFFQSYWRILVNYSFWKATMSSFRLQTSFNWSFKLSVSILTKWISITIINKTKVWTWESEWLSEWVSECVSKCCERHAISLTELLKRENNHPNRKQKRTDIVNSGKWRCREVEATRVKIC